MPSYEELRAMFPRNYPILDQPRLLVAIALGNVQFDSLPEFYNLFFATVELLRFRISVIM